MASSPRSAPLAPAAAVGMLLLLAGCAAGPTFRTPQAPATEQYGFQPLAADVPGDAQRFLAGQVVPGKWWTGYGSPELNRRIEAALAESPTVASAQAALRRAQNLARAAGGAQVPEVDLGLGASRVKFAAVEGVPSSTYTVYSASLNVAYTLDLFGGVRHGMEFAQAGADLQRWVLEGTYLSLASNVTAATIEEGSLRAQLQAADAVVKLLEEQAELTRKQVAIGVKSQAELLAVSAQLAQAQTAQPPLGQALEAVRTRLAVYLGHYPSAARLEVVDLDGLTLPRDLPVVLPSKLVRQRPDVRAAESQLAMATAQAGIAAANLLPQITLGLGYGPQASSPSGFNLGQNLAWNTGLNLLQPIFHGGALRAQKRAAEAGLDQAKADYQGAVLAAFANVSDALNALRFDAQAVQAQGDAEQAAARTLELVKAQYRIGSASYLQLLDATRQWTQARTGLIRARAARLSDTAALYAALGGGWAQ